MKRILAMLLCLCLLLGAVPVLASELPEEKPATKGSYAVPSFGTQPLWEKIKRGIPMAISHKTDWRNFPEASILGINSCLNMGVDIIEVDFHVTKDGVPVALHDDNLRRMTNANTLVYINEITWAQAKKYTLEDGMGNTGTPYILTAEDAKVLNSLPTYVANVGTAKAGGTMPISRFDSILELVNKQAFLLMDKITTADSFAHAYVCAREWDMVEYVVFKGNYNLSQLEPWFTAGAELWNKKHPSDPVTAEEVKTSISFEYNNNKPANIQKLLDAGIRVLGLAAGVSDSNEDHIRNTLVPYCREQGIYLRCNTGDPSYMGTNAKVDCEIGWADLFDIGYTGVMTDRPGPLVNYIQERYRIRSASDRIDAEHFSNFNMDTYGFTVPEDWNAGKNKVVSNLTSKDVLIYENIDFDGTENIFTAKAAGTSSKVTVYLDGTAAANKMGTVSFNSSSYTSAQVKIANVTPGKHTVYLKFTGTVALDQFRFTRGMYFGFSNERLARFRYQDRLYGSLNYDTGNWFPRPASMSSANLNNTAGTMTVNLTAGGNHYIQTGTVVGDRPLHYIPQPGDYFQMRLKISNVTANDTTTAMTAGIVYEHPGKEDFDYGARVTQTITESQLNGKYFVITLPMNSTFTSASEITAFRLYFTNLAPVSGKTASITIDEVYIGPEEYLPEKDYLYFDFTDRDTDEMRYMTSKYGYVNFDTTQWFARTASMRGAWFEPLSATMIARVKEAGNHYIQTGTTVSERPLSYKPSATDYLQMRLRIDHAEANDKTLPLSIGIAYASEARTDFYYNPLLRHNYDASIIGSGYFTVTVPMPEFFIKESEIQSLRIYINNLAPKDGEGVIEVDYFYIGPEDSLPESSHTVTFRNEDGTVLSEQKVSHGGTATYEGATPTKENDADNHYTFAGWDKELTDITADMTLTATYTAIAHTYTYGNEDTANHKGTCSCGHTVSTAHNWDSGTITTTPGCATAGVTIYTCTTCNATKTESVDPTGHSYIRATVAPTCTAEGYTTYICRVCDHSYTDNRVAPKEHTEVIDSAVAPTCTTDGLTEGKHCAVCSAVITPQEAVPAIGHSLAYTSKDDTTHTITCANCDYKEEVSHSYENGLCICGHVEVKEPIQEAGWKIGHSLNLASDISVNYAITKSTLTGFDMDTVYILAEIDVYEGNTKTGTKTLTLLPVEQGSYYYFTLEGLTAVNMNDEIRVVLYGTKDGRVHYSTVDTYSIAAYAYAQFTKTSAPQKLKVLCAELLRYGAKAQIYKSYRTDSLVDAKMTEGQKALLSDMDAVTFNANNVVLDDLTNPSITWKGKALDLASKVTVKFIFDPYGYSGSIEDLSLRMSYEGVDGTIKTLTVEGAELYNASYGFYVFSIDTLLAAELRTVISAQIYAGDTPVSATLQYSADTYGNGKTGNLGDLCKALFAYSDSAKNYFAN